MSAEPTLRQPPITPSQPFVTSDVDHAQRAIRELYGLMVAQKAESDRHNRMLERKLSKTRHKLKLAKRRADRAERALASSRPPPVVNIRQAMRAVSRESRRLIRRLRRQTRS